MPEACPAHNQLMAGGMPSRVIDTKDGIHDPFLWPRLWHVQFHARPGGRRGSPDLVALEAGEKTMPSVLFFSFEDGAVHYGRAAVAEYVTGAEGRLMRSLKSVLGTALFGDTTRVGRAPARVRRDHRHLCRRAQAAGRGEAGGGADQVVVGRPVQFVDDDPVADREAQGQLEAAVRAQGFAHVEFQFEPIAAALDYERQVEREKLALIVDLGGGTSDFSLVRVSPERAGKADRSSDILATAASISAARTSTGCSP